MLKKFNIIDILIVVSVIALAVISFFVLKPIQKKSIPEVPVKDPVETVTIRYQILFEGKEKHIADSLVNPVELFFSDTDDLAGNVISRNSELHRDNVFNKETGEVIKVEHPESYDVYITLETSAEKLKDGVYKIGDSEINQTKNMNFKGKYFFTSGIIYSIEEVKNEG